MASYDRDRYTFANAPRPDAARAAVVSLRGHRPFVWRAGGIRDRVGRAAQSRQPLPIRADQPAALGGEPGDWLAVRPGDGVLVAAVGALGGVGAGAAP